MVVLQRGAPVSGIPIRNAWGDAKALALRWADYAEALGGDDLIRTCVEMAKVWAAVAEAHRPQA